LNTLVVDAINNLEQKLLALPQADVPVSTVSMGGMHARTITIAAGTILTGAVHLTDHLNIMFGDITIAGENGAQRFTGHHVIPSMAGAKRVGYAHADTIWTTILKTTDEDPEVVKDTMTAAQQDDPRIANTKTLEMQGA
jgi:hypothetical protein